MRVPAPVRYPTRPCDRTSARYHRLSSWPAPWQKLWAAVRWGWGGKEIASAGGTPPRGLVAFALLFIVSLNLTVALLDALGIVDVYLMLAVRYVLVDAIPFSVIFCAVFVALDSLLKRYSVS